MLESSIWWWQHPVRREASPEQCSKCSSTFSFCFLKNKSTVTPTKIARISLIKRRRKGAVKRGLLIGTVKRIGRASSLQAIKIEMSVPSVICPFKKRSLLTIGTPHWGTLPNKLPKTGPHFSVLLRTLTILFSKKLKIKWLDMLKNLLQIN